MFRHFLLTTLRNISRNKGYVLINVIGLALGIAFSLLIFMHLSIESGFDRHFSNADNVYRITLHDDEGYNNAQSSPPLGPFLVENYPEVKDFFRLTIIGKRVMSSQLEDGTRIQNVSESAYWADSTFFEILGIEALSGDLNSSLREPNTLVVTKSFGEKFFGDEDPVGKTLYSDRDTERVITAVIDDMPFNSHVQFDYLRPMKQYADNWINNRPGFWDSKSWSGVNTYIELHKNNSGDDFEAKLDDVLLAYWGDMIEDPEDLAGNWFGLQPCRKIHLNPHLDEDDGPRSNILYLSIFAVVALVILIIAAINFVNITVSTSLRRIREISIRKMVGAEKKSIVGQFLFETFSIIFVSSILGLLALYYALPVYTSLTGYIVSIQDLLLPNNILIIVSTITALFLIAGLYPAIFISGFNPIIGMRGASNPKSTVGALRKGLVVVQFAISTFVILSTIIIYYQVNFIRNTDLGFDKDLVVVYNLFGELRGEIFQNRDVYKNQLMSNPEILKMSTASVIPGEHYSMEGMYHESWPEDEWPSVNVLRGDKDILETLGLRLIDGKSFSDITDENKPAFLVNQTTVERLKIEDPVGKRAWNNMWGEYEGEIVGVFQDYNHDSLYEGMSPLVIEHRPMAARYMLIKIAGNNVVSTLEEIDATFKEISPSSHFEHFFLDDHIQHLYKAEMRLSYIFKVFGILGITISCLGLFGISSLNAQQQRQEIGIRKVLGARVQGLFLLSANRYMKLILVANVIAIPAGWYLMHKWLQNFAYRIDISPMMIVMAIVLSLLVALLSVSYQTINVSLVNPIKVIRRE